MPTKQRLVFIGNYGNRNIGDDAILQILSQRYAKRYPDHAQYAFARFFPDDVRRLSNARPLPTTIGAALWCLRRASVLVIGGGGIFGANMGPAARFIPIYTLLGRLLRKDVIYDSVGFYENTPFLQRLLLYVSMATAKRVSVRDHLSWKMTAPVRWVRTMSLVDDPGLAIEPVDTATATALLQREGVQHLDRELVVGLSVKRVIRDVDKSEDLRRSLVGLGKQLIDHHDCTLLFLPFGHDPDKWSENDLSFSESIADDIDRPENTLVVHQYYTPSEFAGIMRLTTFFVGMRFHSQVFAHALKIPLIPIAYEDKRISFVMQHGYPVITIDDVISGSLIEHADRVLRYLRHNSHTAAARCTA